MNFDIRKLQEKELTILKELKRLCDENGLTYYLAFGTLLGAVRHKSFIPWDDDIDVCMPYGDYLKFEQICMRQLRSGFFLQTRNTQPNAGLTYNKLRLDDTTLIVDYMAEKDIHHGINIDIYPLYNVPDSSFQRKRQLMNAAVYMLLEEGRPPENHGGMLKTVGKILLFLIRGKTRRDIKKRCHKVMAAYEDRKTNYKALLFGNLYYCRKLYPAHCFERTAELPFEDDVFSVPVGYDEYLKLFYGDYMQLPPVEKREAKLDHIVLIDTEKSYKEYRHKAYLTGEKHRVRDKSFYRSESRALDSNQYNRDDEHG